LQQFITKHLYSNWNFSELFIAKLNLDFVDVVFNDSCIEKMEVNNCQYYGGRIF